ncbi:hypothetical protein GCM10016272_15120 [Psychrobacter glaciei]|uniref:Uncharacterized protein n=1 Tax=Psychrobacter glaciei TaxID=619771 RepID=A0ABQ3GQQ8_9GAMM|nr:hypothetical protein [Psychrobacter glaciei]GHD32199.1 hypothetical protein GCM10016272_15120 [Psychrobacter glaciei]
MQMKHLIIFALAGIVLLIGFNMFNSNRHESRIAAATSSTTSPATAISSEDTVNTNTDIASQPLGKQPKAILDNATAQIEQAEQLNQERVEQMSDAQ